MTHKFKSYRDLEVWQKAMLAAQMIYHSTRSFPSDERFGLINQMRRCAVSIPSNIAEGMPVSDQLSFDISSPSRWVRLQN